MFRIQSGQSLVEVVVTMAILGLVGMLTGSAIESVQKRIALRSATSEVRATLMYVRTLAVTRDRNVAIRFRNDARGWTWAVVEDGDGDGVRNDDINKGIDREIQPARRFQYGAAGIGLPGVSTPDPFGGKLEDRPPVRFNASMLCSFSRAGEVTNGSVVLTDGERAVVVRAHGRSGRISVLTWNGRKWITGV
jgi:hypothetical protein